MTTRNTIGEFIGAELHRRRLSNRALAVGAGVSESVIRNLLQHGLDPRAKDPDPRTLRAVADFLRIDALKLFRLAGYVPPPSDAHSVQADFVAEVFDRLSQEKQGAVLGVIEALAEKLPDKMTIQDIRANSGAALAGFDLGSPRILRLAANQLIAKTGVTQAFELDVPGTIAPDLVLFTPTVMWSEVPEATQKRVLALAKAKLNLDYDPTMVDAEWRR